MHIYIYVLFYVKDFFLYFWIRLIENNLQLILFCITFLYHSKTNLIPYKFRDNEIKFLSEKANFKMI